MRAATGVVYAAAAVQGIVLVTIPAASSVFTDPATYGLSSARYGAMFLPQVIVAIAAALLGAKLSRRLGTKRIFLAGLGASAVAMLLLLASYPVAHRPGLAYPLLLVATAGVGGGFGLAVPAMNSLTAAQHPGRVDAAVLVLNALLGVGTALAPLFVALFVGLGSWWALPLLSALLLVVALAVATGQPLRAAADAGPRTPIRLPARFGIYGAFAVLYGVCETINGNWSQTDLTTALGATTVVASVALATFWTAVTVGRVGFAALARWFPPVWTYRLLPLVLAIALALIAALPAGRGGLAVAAFGLAGLGCSALLPLTISLAEREFAPAAAGVAGGVIACYQLGYGIAAFGVGPLHQRGVALATCYAATAGVALVLAALAWRATMARTR